MNVDEFGRPVINDVPVFAKLSGGILHCMVRATDESTFDAAALNVGLLMHRDPGSDAVVDEEGNVVTPAVEPSGPLVPTKGNTVTRIGPHVITPGVYDEEGNEITPPVVDNRYHVNFWLGAEAVEREEWVTWIQQWMTNGVEGSPNKNEVTKDFQGIELIDPATVQTPSNVLL